MRAVPTNSRDGGFCRTGYNTTHRVRRIGGKREKRLRVCCSYGCRRLVADDIPENTDPATLPLRPQTLQRLLFWDRFPGEL